MAKDCIGTDVDGMVNGLKDGEVLCLLQRWEFVNASLAPVVEGHNPCMSWSRVLRRSNSADAWHGIDSSTD